MLPSFGSQLCTAVFCVPGYTGQVDSPGSGVHSRYCAQMFLIGVDRCGDSDEEVADRVAAAAATAAPPTCSISPRRCRE